jgi:hypothetical protein
MTGRQRQGANSKAYGMQRFLIGLAWLKALLAQPERIGPLVRKLADIVVLVKALVERDAVARLSFTAEGRAALAALLKDR